MPRLTKYAGDWSALASQILWEGTPAARLCGAYILREVERGSSRLRASTDAKVTIELTDGEYETFVRPREWRRRADG